MTRLKTLATVAGVSVSLLVILMIGTNTCIHLRISALSSVSSVDVASGRSTAHCQGMELCEQKKAYVLLTWSVPVGFLGQSQISDSCSFC